MDKDTKKMKQKLGDAAEELGEGAKDLGDAIMDGAKSVGRKVKDMFSGDKK
jgi:hypothetical protein